MKAPTFAHCALACLASVLLLRAAPVHAQDSGISGVVTDTSGAVLPGVTVEVSSPALIEGVRSAVTDGQGRYNVTNLRPGTYGVTFTLTGFAIVKREGIVLNAGFTAPVNAELKVGSLEETVTVSGASPAVDVQNVRTQQVLTKATLDTLPNAQTMSSLAALTLGLKLGGVVQQDVGGNQGEQGNLSAHANRVEDQKMMLEGMNTNNSMGTNGGTFHAGQHYNMEAFSEVSLTVSGANADVETGGVQQNYVPRDGGNIFSVSGRVTYANDKFQANNLTDELIARGAATPPKIREIYDFAGALGGPIKRDKVWFFTAHRWWGDSTFQPNTFFNATQGTNRYTADRSRPGYQENYNQDNSGRITWQMTSKDKLGYYGNYANHCVCYLGTGPFVAPEAASHNHLPQNHLSQVTFNRVQTNKILIDGGFLYLHNPFGFLHEDRPGIEPGTGRQGVTLTHIPMTELTTNFTWNARSSGTLPYTDCANDAPGVCDLSEAGQQNGRASVSVVTGSHAFKAGFTMSHGLVEQNGSNNVLPGFGPVHFDLFNGAPASIRVFAHPKYSRVDFRNVGFYAQDQWTLKTVTLNFGIRRDMFNGWSPEQATPDGSFVPGFRTAQIENTPKWRNVSPRFGVAWDVAGNGKTAVKASAGRYVAAAGAGTVQPTNPVLAIVTQATRTWNDADGDFFPDGDARSTAANGELGPLSDLAFGTPRITTFFDPDMLTDNRGYTWQVSTGLAQELRDNMGASVTYFRTMHFNQIVTDNTLVTPSDYDTFCVTAPTDARLPGGGGYPICNQALVKRAAFGQVRSLVRNEKTFGNWTEVFNGVDAEMHARFPGGALLQGGISVGRTVDDHCFVIDSPQGAQFGLAALPAPGLYQCRIVTPWWAGNGQVKIAGSYPLPLGIELSAVYQNLPGIPILANGVFTSAQIAGVLGRNPPQCASDTGACTATVSVAMIDPNTVYEDRINQIDFRVAKLIRSPFGRFRATLDLYNMTNASTIQGRNNTFGPAWGTPTRIMGGRLIKLGAQYDF